MWCSETGFDPTKPAVVYLIEHDDLDAWKIGIANVRSDRIPNHHRWVASVERCPAVEGVGSKTSTAHLTRWKAVFAGLEDWHRAGDDLDDSLGSLCTEYARPD